MAQIKSYKEKKIRKSKEKTSLFATISTTVFMRIISLISPKIIWKENMRDVGIEFNKGVQVVENRV